MFPLGEMLAGTGATSSVPDPTNQVPVPGPGFRTKGGDFGSTDCFQVRPRPLRCRARSGRQIFTSQICPNALSGVRLPWTQRRPRILLPGGEMHGQLHESDTDPPCAP